MSDANGATFLAALQANVGATGTSVPARDAVNPSMIRHWCDSMEDTNPNYVDAAHAAAGPHGGIVAPPTMLNAWTMIGNIPRTLDPDDPQGGVNARLDAAGYVGVVATNSEHVYRRYLRPGDVVTSVQKLVDVSEEKQTGLGIGHFVTTRIEYETTDGEPIAKMLFRILKFKPGTGRGGPAPAAAAEAPAGEGADKPRPKRPRPATTIDNAFWFEAAKQHKLVIQRCASCKVLRHPPRPRCDKCGSYEWDALESSGRGVVYSFVVNHYPQVPAFDYPLPIGLIELEEGTRLVAQIVDCPIDEITVGMLVEVTWIDADDELTIPAFKPVPVDSRASGHEVVPA